MKISPPSFIKNFNFHSMRFKIFIISVVITIAMVFISSYVIIQKAADNIIDNAYDYIYESMRHADANLDIFLEDAIGLSIAIASNKDIVIDALLDNSPAASFTAFEKQVQVENYLKNLKANKNHILLAATIGVDGKAYKSSGTLILRSVVEEKWFTETSAKSNVRLFYNTPDEKRIAICRPIMYNGELLGIALIELRYEILNSLYSITPLQNTRISSFTEDGSLVFTNYDTNRNDNIIAEHFNGLTALQDGRKTKHVFNGKEMLVAKYTSDISGLTTIGLVSYDDLLTEALDLRKQAFTIITLSVIAATLVAWLFAKYISRNIFSLQESMQKISRGEINSRAEINTKDEIGIMAGIFNEMMDKIAFLMKDIKTKEKQKRKAEQDALEAQIQPHFIYNTINIIAYTAHIRGIQDIEEVSTATVELLRGVLGVRESFIPLWQECEYIEQYLKVQKFKMQKQFSIVWDVQPDLWLYKIPKLLIQPIVENAVIHGICAIENGQINVQASINENKVFIRVTDNGKGIDRDLLNELNHPENDSSKFRPVGFANVRGRVKAIYGESYDVNISSVEKAFTSVEIILPFPYDNGEDE